jgi:poly-gamma-glutamate system protein
MKGIYWRPRKVSRWVLLGLAVASIAGMAAVELRPWPQVAADRADKLAASFLAERAMDLVKEERLRRGHAIDEHFDPAKSGLIGESMSLVTSVPGNLRAKQTSINPNFAAAVVDMLREAGVEKGDRVAVGCSGSFPALNICVYAALEQLEARPIVVASACASQFGANLPELMWVDMERLLYSRGLFSFRSKAASLGGYEDNGRGMSPEAREVAVDALDRNLVPLLDGESLAALIDQRMQVYLREASREPIKAYINVGGGAASVGRTEGKNRYEPGLNIHPPADALEIDSVMTRFAQQDVPVIHLVEAVELAEKYGLPEAPQERPAVGAGGVYETWHYNRPLAALVLVALLFAMRSLVWSDLGVRVRSLIARLRGDRHARARLYATEGDYAV